MKLKLDKCLEMDAFKDAKLLAGKGNLDQVIRSLSMLESSEEEEVAKYMAHSGDLVLTGFFGAKDDPEKQKAVIRQLSKAKAV